MVRFRTVVNQIYDAYSYSLPSMYKNKLIHLRGIRLEFSTDFPIKVHVKNIINQDHTKHADESKENVQSRL